MHRFLRRHFARIEGWRQDVAGHGSAYRRLLANMNIAWHWSTIVLDEGGQPVDLLMMDCNDACLRAFDMPRERMVGRRHTEIWPTTERFWFHTQLEVALTGKSFHFERASTTTEAYWDCYLYAPEELAVGMFFHDITERQRSEKSIRSLNQALSARASELEAVIHELDAFTHTVSHELGAPIRHIAGFADLLDRELGPGISAKGRHYLDTIRHSAQGMAGLMDRLLELARSGRAPVQLERVPLGEVAAKAWEDLASERAGRTIRWELGPLPTVSGDPILLRDVLVNLLGNALKFSLPRAEARIDVGCVEALDECIIFVRDNGVGFDPGLTHQLFTPFRRLHSDDEIPGNGVGLDTVRRIIQRHGGRVWAEGAVDRGATVYFSLPN